MKKSLFAVAALSAIAGTAQAQSSVTVYGLIDLGYIGSNQKVVGLPSTTQQLGATSSAFGQSAENTSRLGFKGTEDLGGGLSAFFTVETGLTPGGSTLGGTSLNNRQSFVGLKKNGVGQFALGTQYTTVFNAAAATDPGQLNNIAGNVIYATQTGATVAPNGALTTSGTASSGQTDAFTNRVGNALTVSSDTFAGFQVNALYTLNNANSSQLSSSSGGSNNASGWGIGANYTWNKLLVTANYQSFKAAATTWTNATTPLPAAWGAGYVGTQTTDNQTYVAATYDFGILKAYAQWVSRKVTDTENSNFYGKRNAQQLGVRSYITPAIEAWASVGNGKITAFGQSNPSSSFTGYQLGSNYYLSKRTNLYAIYGSNQSSASTVSTAASINNYAIGVRHTF